jgi:hypothetical protein
MRRWVSHHKGVTIVLALLTIVGGGLRGHVAASPHRNQSADERAYARLARNLVRHHSYTAPEMADPTHWAPGAPLAFAIAQRVRPRYPDHPVDIPSAYPLQAALGTAQIPAAFILAFLIAGPAAGLIAAAAVAGYPPLISASADLLSEPLGALMLLIALIAVVLALQRGGWWRAVVAGLLLGFTVLVRADMLPIPFGLVVLFGVVGWRRASWRAGLRMAVPLLAAIVVVLAPWSIYASIQSGRLTPVSSGGSSNLYVGTYLPGNGSMFGVKQHWAARTVKKYPEERGEPYWRISQIKVISTIAATHPGLDQESALRAAALDNVRDYVLGDPIGFAGLAVRKVLRMWDGYSIGTFGHRHVLITIYHVLVVLLGALGLIAGLVARRGRSPELWTIVVSVGLLTIMNIILVAEARHNMPLIPVFVCGGAAGAALAVERWRRPREPEAPKLPAAACVPGPLPSSS